jgi:hypothetical protein
MPPLQTGSAGTGQPPLFRDLFSRFGRHPL